MILPLDQIGIIVAGVSSTWLSQHKVLKWRRWSSVIGLAAQPFWFYASWKAQQWGIFFAAFLYTYAWGTGIYNNWIKKGIV